MAYSILIVGRKMKIKLSKLIIVASNNVLTGPSWLLVDANFVKPFFSIIFGLVKKMQRVVPNKPVEWPFLESTVQPSVSELC